MEKAVNGYLENFLNGSSIATPSVTAMPCLTFEEGAPDCRQKRVLSTRESTLFVYSLKPPASPVVLTHLTLFYTALFLAADNSCCGYCTTADKQQNKP